ncbi:hypothetical protein SKAU_G00024720 [Synaphobranchus kaupii]|uniref:Uncharacterized protein n=1 Tax=Synaphobranchus kaupii TaxID=118154 RepID=A0A9Q1GCK1_SYNKA|nr:hypothetical protein SKAU_G00024720 [Synaphobranchus kaupii]
MQGAQPGALTFVVSQQGKARREWERAFVVCHRLQNWPPVLEQLGNVRLTQRDPVQIPACFGVIRWAQQKWFWELIRRWAGVFAAHEEDFGKIDAVLHNIPTGEASPSRERYRPLPPSLFPELRSLLREMLEGGVIAESASP